MATVMTGIVDFPKMETDAKRELEASVNELLDGLFSGYKYSAEVFRTNPTRENWRTLKQAHACWRVAFAAEHEAEKPG